MVESPQVESPQEMVARNSRLACWRKAVLNQYGNRCVNCSSKENLQAMLVVPEAAGGRYTVENSTAVCRDCVIAKAAVEQAEMYGKPLLRPINIWVSRKLYDDLKAQLEERQGFVSMSSLVRYMVGRVVENPSLFWDLEYYQDRGSDLKVNLWVDTHEYEKFKKVLTEGPRVEEGYKILTVTDGIKALMLLYLDNAALAAGRK